MNEVMNGIEILNQIEIMQTPLWIEILFITCCVIMCISFGVGLAAAKSDKEILAIVFLIIAGVCAIGILISFFCMVFIEEPTGKYEYDCLISEDVSMTEFYEKYDVIEVNGQIWTIKEK